MNVTRANGVQLHYSVEGPEDRPVIVFSNSLGTDFRVWDRLVDRFDERYRMVRYDKRGHGLSEMTPAPYAMDDHVGDLIGLLDHLRLDSVVVCGLSVGGMIAQGLAARQPERMRAMILMDTAAKIGTAEMWNDRIKAIEAGGIEVLADPIMERWLSATFRAEKPEETLVWRNMLTRTTRDGYLGTSAA
ncbi:MAG: alpha/beta fold hydrolase, partial [Pseudomonadota bacterium]